MEEGVKITWVVGGGYDKLIIITIIMILIMDCDDVVALLICLRFYTAMSLITRII